MTLTMVETTGHVAMGPRGQLPAPQFLLRPQTSLASQNVAGYVIKYSSLAPLSCDSLQPASAEFDGLLWRIIIISMLTRLPRGTGVTEILQKVISHSRIDRKITQLKYDTIQRLCVRLKTDRKLPV